MGRGFSMKSVTFPQPKQARVSAVVIHGNVGYRDYLRKLCNDGRIEEAFRDLHLMDQQGIPVSVGCIYCLLQGCTKKQDLTGGRLVHSLMVINGLETVDYLGGHLIRVFALCGSLTDAYYVFSNISKPTVYSWNAIILAHAALGCNERALNLYQEMQQESIQADKVSFLCISKACSNMRVLPQCRLIHEEIIRSGLESDIALSNTLIDTYAKCESLEEARALFDRMAHLSVVSWGSMMAGYAAHGYGALSLELLKQMEQKGIKPNKVIFSCILKACSSIGALIEGRLIHEDIIRSGIDSDGIVGNTLVDMYAKCGSLEEAYKSFKDLPHQTEMSWGALIAGYGTHGHTLSAIEQYEKMQELGVKPNRAIFLGLLSACGTTGSTRWGQLMHDEVIRSGLKSDPMVASALVDMYAKCGSLEEAYNMFIHDRTVVSWGALINGYVMHGHDLPALGLLEKMQEETKPDRAVFLPMLRACGNIGAIREGRLTHDMIVQAGFGSDVAIGSSLVDMYVKCGYLEEAQQTFDSIQTQDVVSWGSIIAGYVQHGHGIAAIELYKKMQQQGIKPNSIIFVCTLRACGSVGAIAEGRVIHGQILRTELESAVGVGNSLLEMYARCGSMCEARKVFDKLPDEGVLSWSIMIAGYAHDGKCMLARQCLEAMQYQGLKPDEFIFTSMLAAYCQAGLLEEGCQYFENMKCHGITPGIEHYSCMVDLLGRAGCLNEAKDFLTSIPITPCATMWTSLLTSCRTYGHVEIGRQCFNKAVQLDPYDASGYVLMSNIYADGCMWKDHEDIIEFQKCTGVHKMPGMAFIEFEGEMYEFIVESHTHAVPSEIFRKLDRLSGFMQERGHIPQIDLVLDCMKDNTLLTSIVEDEGCLPQRDLKWQSTSDCVEIDICLDHCKGIVSSFKSESLHIRVPSTFPV